MVQIYQDEGEDWSLQIIAFPSNEFGGQEPGSEQEISDFARVKYGVKFPITEKVTVNGADCHPVYQYLR